MSEKKLLYIFDVLCGWCFVSSAAVKEVAQWAEANKIDFEFHHSRLFTDNYVPEMTPNFVDMVKTVGSQRAKELGGVSFSQAYYDLISSESFQHSSHLTSLGVAAAKKLATSEFDAYTYSKRLQDLVFLEGKNPNDHQTLIEASSGLFDKDAFTMLLEDTDTLNAALEEARIARDYGQQLGVNGVPALFLYDVMEDSYTKLNPLNYQPSLSA